MSKLPNFAGAKWKLNTNKALKKRLLPGPCYVEGNSPKPSKNSKDDITSVYKFRETESDVYSMTIDGKTYYVITRPTWYCVHNTTMCKVMFFNIY